MSYAEEDGCIRRSGCLCYHHHVTPALAGNDGEDGLEGVGNVVKVVPRNVVAEGGIDPVERRGVEATVRSGEDLHPNHSEEEHKQKQENEK